MEKKGTYLVQAEVPQHVPPQMRNVERPIVHAILAGGTSVYLAQVSNKTPTVQQGEFDKGISLRQAAVARLFHPFATNTELKCWLLAPSDIRNTSDVDSPQSLQRR
jgi:hypothetical protein